MVNTYYDASFADGILFTLQSQETTAQETTTNIKPVCSEARAPY